MSSVGLAQPKTCGGGGGLGPEPPPLLPLLLPGELGCGGGDGDGPPVLLGGRDGGLSGIRLPAASPPPVETWDTGFAAVPAMHFIMATCRVCRS